MERIFSRAFDSLQEAWKTIIDISPSLEALGDESAIYANCFS